MKLNKEYFNGLITKIGEYINIQRINFIESKDIKKLIHLYNLNFNVEYFNNYQWNIKCSKEETDQEYLPKYWELLSNTNKEKWVVTYLSKDIQSKMREM